MNISTGGPHILLFERDQQFAMLLNSELQLAGYTNHTARTAVEVFDAIARFPIRLVLVNLAQAATARREFWVALDTQRRDRKVQVLTFLSSNLASYGPSEFEDHAQHANVDMEIDGMLGLMSLVDAVRNRVPSATVPMESTNSGNTLPRMPRFSTSNQNPVQTSSMGSGNSFPTALSSDTNSMRAAPRPTNSQVLPQTPVNNPIQSPPTYSQQTTAQNTNPSPITGMPGSNQPSYSEKIRAVLYPNQRNWNTPDTGNQNIAVDQREKSSPPPAQPTTSTQFSSYETPALQRLANGQNSPDNQNESSLAQLSRMVQGFRSPARDEQSINSAFSSTTSQWTPLQTSSYNTPPSPPTEQVQYQQPAPQTEGTHNSAPFRSTVSPSATSYSTLEARQERGINQEKPIQQQAPRQHHNFAPPVMPVRQPTQGEDRIGTQPLRASPIQDMPIERTVTGPAINEMNRRPDVLSRTNYGPQTAHQPAVNPGNQHTSPHLASISAAMPVVTPPPAPVKEAAAIPPTHVPNKDMAELFAPEIQEAVATKIPEPAPNVQETPETKIPEAEAPKAETTTDAREQTVLREKDKSSQATFTRPEELQLNDVHIPDDVAESMTTNNAVLLDIVQSLPPMPSLAQQQAIEPQVLNGRATRSLNKVLLDGHLVPQDRLEVAQNIQRMLRGVDLNYQLGEILLMFKLLTPDQLLAASLVSYGLITTTQISALGKIRQELHSMGLEYDLENLLILFRILTPEQLREARSSLQTN
ncbi:hypothetical protein KDA_26990 [Dictyobacter alpinus]|uniref:Uncharacterized protein n=1 Tax=Dictyobacter alpinus TaxID=2014873 RepID=A0A402B784_9CHLR|nr:hypothetical protein [Dictyobacter alpinus]GCE27215.1 hypothetical protein KDA_26990 [Dictyobacter alpinus]